MIEQSPMGELLALRDEQRQQGALRTRIRREKCLQRWRSRSAMSNLGLSGSDAGDIPPSPRDYKILGRLGQGGMGVLYTALHVHLNRVVVLKMLSSAAAAKPERLERFRHEGEWLALVRHPNVVQVFDAGEDQGRPWFAMEYVPDGDLRSRLKGRPQPPADAAGLVERVALGMQAVHDAGLLYLDTKPDNVLLAAAPATGVGSTHYGVPKIADVGLARPFGAGAPAASTLAGTPPYMAPEQVRCDPLSPATDVYGLGALLYEMLTGRPPFQGTDHRDILGQVLKRPIMPLRNVPPALDEICRRCLAKDAAERYPTALALAEDLHGFLKTVRDAAARRRPHPLRAALWGQWWNVFFALVLAAGAGQ